MAPGTSWAWRSSLSSWVALQNSFLPQSAGALLLQDKADQILMLLVCGQCLRTGSQRREAAFSSEKSCFIGWATEYHLMSVLAEGTEEGGGWGGIEREAKWWAKTELSDSVHSNCSQSDEGLKVGRITTAHWDKFLKREDVDALFTSSHPSHQWQFKAPQTYIWKDLDWILECLWRDYRDQSIWNECP